MPADVELLPCPFCGSGAEAETYVVEAQVVCLSCRAKIVRQHGARDDNGLPEAIAAWNIRAHATAAKDAESEALRAEVAEWKRVASAQAELHGEAEARAERLAEALDIIARVGKASRNQTTRTRWIVARAVSALNGDEDWQALPKPKGFHNALLHPTAAQEKDDA